MMVDQNRLCIGFIGTGSIGKPLARCLAEGGYPIMLSDASRPAVRRYAAEIGARVADSPATLAASVDVVIMMLPNSHIVREVVAGSNGVIVGARPGMLLIDMSSGIPEITRELGAQARRAGAALIDAPVSGGVAAAEKGELTIMVGGAEQDIELARPILETMGSRVITTGGIGSAHAMKALNNMISAAGFVASMEALLIGKRAGLDPQLMVDVLNASSGANSATQRKLKQCVLSGKYESGFSLDLMLKDVSIAADMADETETAVQFTRLCRDLWKQAADYLGSGQDHTAMAKYLEHVAYGDEPKGQGQGA